MSRQTFTIKQLEKTDNSLTRSPNLHKYYISCSGRITHDSPTSESWLRILKLIKVDISDIDKSWILLGYLDKYGEIVVKIGDVNSMQNEYNNSTYLYSLKGFVKYICFFTCNDDFRTIPSESRTSICKGPGNTMGIILMPYFELGSLARYTWNKENKIQLHACLKNALLSIITLFHKLNIIHGDFHPGNVLLKRTKQTYIDYNIPEIGTFSIKTFGIRTWIMDFENMKHADFSNRSSIIVTFNDFYYDIQKFFMFLYNTIRVIDQRTIAPITGYISRKSMDSKYLTKADIDEILSMIDMIELYD